jgi:hypothetical protein
MGPQRGYTYLQSAFHDLVRRAGGGKNLAMIIIGIIIACVVAIGWGLSELQTSQAIIEANRLATLLHR